ncbi:MAG: DUF262 domain-containing protein [Pseudomonadota bacterium]
MKIKSIKPQLTPLRDFWNEDAGTLRIPTIQRQFVWDAEDVRDLIDSIVSGYPIGAIIIWEPSSEFPSAPLIGKDGTDTRRYVLDGQQRLTALSLVMNGWQLDRGAKTIRTSAISYVPETGKFYLSEKKGIDVSLIVKAALADADALTKLQKNYSAVFRRVIDRVGSKIVGYQLPMYVLKTDSADDEEAYERIAEIFTRVNSAGVKIGNLEMFLSFFAAAFPRQEKDRVISLHEKLSASFELDLEPLVRLVFSRMGMTQNQITKISSFRKAIQTLKERYKSKPKDIGIILDRCETATRAIIDLLRKDLGIATSQFIPSQNTLLTLFDFAYTRGFGSQKEVPPKDRRRMLYWFLVGSFNGIYSSSPNSKIEEDLGIIRRGKGSFPLDELLDAMKRRPPRANAIDRNEITEERYNVLRGRTGKEYLMLLDVLLHRNHATNWAGKDLISEDSAIHHIFPREFLKEKGETRDEYINCVGNLTFIDPGVNSEIGDTPPEDYLRDYTGIFDEHMIPDNSKLWRFDEYERFLELRLKAVWKAASAMLDELHS